MNASRMSSRAQLLCHLYIGLMATAVLPTAAMATECDNVGTTAATDPEDHGVAENTGDDRVTAQVGFALGF